MVEPISVDDPMSTLFKIGDVAILLGITSETIRRYEEQGIVMPTKSKKTGYRYYQTWDIRALTRARMYRKLGYSLAEAADLINNKEVPDIVSSLADKEADIEKEITWHMNLLKHTRWLQSVIADADANVGKYRIENRPPMYRIDISKLYELFFDPDRQDLYRSWSSKGPFVSPSALFQKDLLDKESYDVSYGLVINEEYAALLNIKPSKDVTFYPSCLCVYTTMQVTSETLLSFQNFAPVIDYINDKGLKLCGDVIGRVVLTIKRDDRYTSWYQIWMPVE